MQILVLNCSFAVVWGNLFFLNLSKSWYKAAEMIGWLMQESGWKQRCRFTRTNGKVRYRGGQKDEPWETGRDHGSTGSGRHDSGLHGPVSLECCSCHCHPEQPPVQSISFFCSINYWLNKHSVLRIGREGQMRQTVEDSVLENSWAFTHWKLTLKKMERQRYWRDGSVVQSRRCPCGGPEFSSKYPSLVTAPGNSLPLVSAGTCTHAHKPTCTWLKGSNSQF